MGIHCAFHLLRCKKKRLSSVGIRYGLQLVQFRRIDQLIGAENGSRIQLSSNLCPIGISGGLKVSLAYGSSIPGAHGPTTCESTRNHQYSVNPLETTSLV